jgi:phosphoglycerate dehydrogenase-like enzyme
VLLETFKPIKMHYMHNNGASRHERVRIGVVIPVALREELFHPRDIERLNNLGDVHYVQAQKQTSKEEALDILRHCEIGVGSWGTPYPDAELLDACPGIKLWEHAAGTVKYMFGPHLQNSGLKIASCKTAIATDVAEMTIGLIITTLRRIPQNAEANRVQTAVRPAHLKILRWSMIGIIGASEVGRLVIEHLRGFGCSVQLFDPYVSKEAARELGVTLCPDLTTLCATSDVVSLHTPLLPETRNLLSTREFQAMHDYTIFINTSRGGCIDEAALIVELQQGRLYACLDVSSPEPAEIDSPLRTLPNVMYTSHIAGPPSFTLGRQAVDDIEKYINGGEPLYIVHEEMLERIA